MFSILTAGSIGGVASYISGGTETDSVGAAIQGARSGFRKKMREMDSSYYRRGAAYEACAQAYGARMAGKIANGDITLSCECFDRTSGLLAGLDRETALKALGPGTATASGERIRVTIAAKRVLRHCDIDPWKGGPAMPELRRGKDVIAKSKPADNRSTNAMPGNLRGTF